MAFRLGAAGQCTTPIRSASTASCGPCAGWRRTRTAILRHGSQRLCSQSSLPKGNPSAHRGARHDRRRHRLHRPHRSGKVLARRPQHDPRRDPRRSCRPRCRGACEDRSVRGGGRDHGLRPARGHHRRQRGRQIALRAGLPVTTAGTTINRFCSSGLQAIALAAQRVIVDKVPIMVAGGLESISLVQNEHMNLHRLREEWLEEHKPEIYMTMIETAEVVAKRYYITREKQDEYALVSQQRTAAGQKAGRFDAEIVPMPTKKVAD